MALRVSVVGFLLTLTAAVAVAQEIYRAGDGISVPTVISRVLPKYPREAADAGLEGRVVMAGIVQTDGRITDVRVTQSVDKQLDAAAVTAVRQWRFEPGRKDGKTVAVRCEYDVTFTLQKRDRR